MMPTFDFLLDVLFLIDLESAIYMLRTGSLDGARGNEV